MKKTLHFLLLSLVALIALPMNAQTVVTFTAGVEVGTQTNAGDGADEMSKDGITISVTKGALAAAQYRFAKSQTMTISSTVGNITNVVFMCTANGDAQYGPANFTDPTTGTYAYEDNTGVWMGDAAEFSMTASTAQVRCTMIMVTVGGEVGPGPGDDDDDDDDMQIVSSNLEETDNQIVFTFTGYDKTNDYQVQGVYTFNFVNNSCTSAVLAVTYPTAELAQEGYQDALEDAEEAGYTDVKLEGNTVTAATNDFLGMTKELVKKFLAALTGDDVDFFTGDGTLANPFTPEDANLLASTLDNGELTDLVYVKGKISSIKYTFSAAYGTATFFISEDGTTEGSQFQCYAVYYLENKSWVDGNTQIAVGDDVIIYGKLTNYNGNTPETASKEAYIYSLNGVTKAETVVTPDAELISVAKALELINALEDGKTTEESYRVKGFIVGAPDFQRKADGTLYGNVNLAMADEKGGATTLTVFRAKSFDNEAFTEETITGLNEGDEVVFEGKLQKYVKDDVTTPELTGGKLISVNGKTSFGETPEPVIETISVEQALDMINDELEDGKSTANNYYVAGYVVGIPDFQRKADGTLYGNVNFLMADELNGEPTLTVFRAKSFDNAVFTEETIGLLKEGDEVVVCGKLQRYVKDDVMTPEISSCFIYSINGQTSGISHTAATTAAKAQVYNLQGQRVAQPAHGLYIVGGKKYFVK